MTLVARSCRDEVAPLLKRRSTTAMGKRTFGIMRTRPPQRRPVPSTFNDAQPQGAIERQVEPRLQDFDIPTVIDDVVVPPEAVLTRRTNERTGRPHPAPRTPMDRPGESGPEGNALSWAGGSVVGR